MAIAVNTICGPVDGLAAGKLSTDAVGNFYVNTPDGQIPLPDVIVKALDAIHPVVVDAQLVIESGGIIPVMPATIYMPDVPGLFRVSLYALTDGNGDVGATLSVDIGWNDALDNRIQAVITSLPLDAGGFAQGSCVLYGHNSDPVTYDAAMAGAGGETEAWTLYVALERLT